MMGSLSDSVAALACFPVLRVGAGFDLALGRLEGASIELSLLTRGFLVCLVVVAGASGVGVVPSLTVAVRALVDLVVVGIAAATVGFVREDILLAAGFPDIVM